MSLHIMFPKRIEIEEKEDCLFLKFYDEDKNQILKIQVHGSSAYDATNDTIGPRQIPIIETTEDYKKRLLREVAEYEQNQRDEEDDARHERNHNQSLKPGA